MDANGYKSSGYRWAVLGVFAAINLVIQILWIAYAPVTQAAASYYGVSELAIGFFAMSFMIAFLPLSIPVSWAIDKFGFRITVGFGAVLMGAFGLLRGFAGHSYALALVGTLGVAAAQPFLLNAWTTVPVRWFPPRERATAVGIVTLGNLVGTAIGMVVTPALVEGMGMAEAQLAYGVAAAASAALFLVVARERPKTPPSADSVETRALMLDGLKHAFSLRDFRFYLAISFIGLGLFNGLNTWIEGIVRPRGFDSGQAGTLGAVMLAGGLVGAIVLPALSDRSLKRTPYMALGLAGAVPALLGVAFAPGYAILLASGFLLGFFLVGMFPVGMQYAAEISRPTPEGTSNGLIQLFGQLSVVFVYLMELTKDRKGSFTPSLVAGCVLLALCAFVAARLKEPVRQSKG